MPRLSRLRYPRATLVIAIALWLALEGAAVYLLVLDLRVTRQLVRHTWRVPTVILSAAGGPNAEVTRLYGVDWRPTPPVSLTGLPRYVGDAFMAAEDVRFRHHFGIDPIGILRALVADIRSRGIAEGGSTIDQQIIRARFLTQERTWRRKIVEMILAVLLDARMSKDEILEIYLNDVYLGHNAGKPVLGIDEASRLYFGKPPSRLRLDQAALLASIVRAPNRDTPEKRPDVVRARRDAILQVMRKRGWITDPQYRDAVLHGVQFTTGSIPRAPYPFYLRALRSEIVQQIGVAPVIEGGLTITCEIDPEAQGAAERAARRGPLQLEAKYSWIRRQSEDEPLQVAILSVDPRTGGVRALVGGSDFDLSPFDRTSSMRRQPGSAFKAFAYAAAIASRRVTTASLLLDAPLSVDVSGGQTWQPHNYDMRYRGRVSVREAFEESLNVPTVRLSQQVGIERVASTAENFGFAEHFGDIPALPLGVTEVTVRELTAAYTAFPTLGLRLGALPGPRSPQRRRQGSDGAPRGPEARDRRRRRVRHAHAAARRRRARNGVPPEALRAWLRRRKNRYDERLPRCLVRRLHPRYGHHGVARLRSRRTAAPLVRRGCHPDLGLVHERDPAPHVPARAASGRDIPGHRSRDRHAVERRLSGTVP